ncbi:MAG TPA: hypothetical protein PLK92_00995 [Candidatus Paceibacterota bacterium]|jgi:hypothetical protein|nr:hypothetical protein [Candidatus Paceibacterota bacterium]HOY10963.1 hypothetical protein [Candidatus Paceibacterota bacterium]HPI24600.1 hypothetical protein [Candidatus Paceibacterota bacterium]HPN89658.1 hypothetical protein [Candidatus Paceibacterota bacterium]HPV33432.1 hypothetical protein [Candidatus Paceibacterota bacterium]
MADIEKDNNIRDNNMGQGIDSRFLKFAFLKSKKLVQATYLVTSFISDSEPLKWRIRESVLELMSDTSLLVPTSSLSDGSGEGQISPLFKISVLEAVLNRLDQVANLLDIASAAGFASEMNLAILKNEFRGLGKNISSKLGRGLKEIVGPEEASQLLLEAREKYPVGGVATTMGHNISETNYNANVRLSEMLSERLKGTEAGKEKDLYQKEGGKKNRRLVNKDARRLEIISFLKGKSWTSIKDISDAISDCSTKTIQRELADLVQKGVLKKKGDRRWSRYLLA